MKIHGYCTNCKEKVTIDIEKLEMKMTKTLENASTDGQSQILEKPEVIEKEVIKTVIEDFKPNYECPDGNCEIGVHKNKNYKKKAKGKCTNCDQFTKHSKGTCPWCKKNEIDELEEGELEELGIIEPIIDDHEGHDHE